jgi:hypothetical protein
MVLGRLLSATALNMVVLPALYWVDGDRVVAVERAAVELGEANLAVARPA